MKNIFTLLISFISVCVFAQQATITGTLIDDNNEPLFACNVIIDASKGIATQSNFDGVYTLKVDPGKYFVLFSYIGMDNEIREINVTANQVLKLDVTLNTKETQIDIVTITGGKYEKKLGEETVSIEVMPANIIENNAAQADEALTKVPGYTKIGKNASIRGGSGFAAGASSRVMVLVDDLPALSAENGSINFSNLPIENLQQVEVIKGASSAMYGSSAMNGIINFRTAWPKKDKVFRRLTVSGGFYQRYNAKLIKTKKFNDRSKNIDSWQKEEKHIPAFGNLTYEHRQKFKHIDLVFGAHYRADQGFRKNNELQRVRLNGKIRHISKKVEGLTLGMGWNTAWENGAFFFLWSGADSLANLPSATPVAFNADGSPNPPLGVPKSDQRTSFLSRKIELTPFVNYYDKKDNKHSVKLRYYNNYDTNFGYEELITNHVYGEYTFYRDFKELGVNFTTGISGFYTNTKGKTFGDDTYFAANAGAFAQVDKKFFDKLTVSAGVRLEYNQVDSIVPQNEIRFFSWFKKNGVVNSPVKPIIRIGLNYEPVRGTFIRASYGEGFRVPTINEFFVFTARGVLVVPNPELKPERGWSAELGVKQAVKVGKWKGYFDFAGFITEYYDYIDFLGSGNPNNIFEFNAQNIENARISGGEVTALGQGELFGIPLNFLAGYTFTSPINLDSKSVKYKDKILNFRNLHSLKADVEATYKRLTFGVASLYNSNMINISASQELLPGVLEYRKKDDDGYILFDMRLRYDIKEKAKVSFIVKNLFNEEYSTRPGIVENPRYFTVQYQHEF
ncbi:MAG: TonB-dependent receptor [Chitinophagales bacterium]